MRHIHFDRRKEILAIIIIGILFMFFVGCGTKKELSRNQNDTVTSNSPLINTSGIVEQIERSSMPDSGYRFANAAYASQISPYATYYIREAKKLAGNVPEKETIAMEPVFLDKLETETAMDLTDLYCMVMLIDDLNKVSIPMKENISRNLDSLYNEKIGCYSLPASNQIDIYATNVYPTFLVETIASKLDIETRPVKAWLGEAASELLQPENITRENSSTYEMLFKLLQLHQMEISKEASALVIKMFEDDLQNLTALKEANQVYLPVYLMDYLETCVILDIDSSSYHNQIIQSICDENGMIAGVIQDYDALGLYAAVRTLSLSNYDFKKHQNINKVFDVYNTFLLDNSAYLAPGHVESDFVDTYYVDAIIHMLELEHPSDISVYCREKKDEILKSDLISISYFIALLQRNNLLNILDDRKPEIVDGLNSSLENILASEGTTAEKLPYVNAIIDALEILGQEWSISETQAEEMIGNYTEAEDIQQDTINLIELTKFTNAVGGGSKDSKKYCKKIVDNIQSLKNLEVSNQMLILSKACVIFEDCNYTIPDSVIQIVTNTLNQAQDSSGLFKGGDTKEDIVSFRSTYDALLLQQLISQN